MSSSSSESSDAPCCACRKELSFFWSAAGKAAASSITLTAEMRLAMLPVSTCTRAAPPLACFSRIPTARSRASTAPMSSFSLAEKSVASFSLMPVAFLSSAVRVAISPASLPMLVSATSMLLASSLILAVSFSTEASPVLISLAVFLAVSSHHSKYSLKAFCWTSPSDSILAWSSSMSLRTCARGFVPASDRARAAVATGTAARKST
mmetsp:Transcript_54248/g.159577  ORF Transcript_54248/g.159577 Transcript_54248/m.159577 type:complete len:207 (-) Transcript_54248:87-707(-)